MNYIIHATHLDESDDNKDFIKIYQYPKWFKLFISVLSPPIITLFIWLGVYSVLFEQNDWWLLLLIETMSLLMILLCGWGMVEVFYSKLYLSNHSIRIQSLFQNNELQYEEIQSIKTIKYQNETRLVLKPYSKSFKKIRVSNYFEDYSEIEYCIKIHLKALNKDLKNSVIQ